jgi:single-strand DNA-binding protein
VVWGRRAEVCGQFLTKGSPVFVEGRLQSRSWQTQDGQKRSTIEVVANSVQFLGRGKGDSAQAPAEESVEEGHSETGPVPPQTDSEVPF